MLRNKIYYRIKPLIPWPVRVGIRRLFAHRRRVLARESWPGNLWENDQAAREWMQRFRGELNLMAAFFDAGPVAEGSEEPAPSEDFRAAPVLNERRTWAVAAAWEAGDVARAAAGVLEEARDAAQSGQADALRSLLEKAEALKRSAEGDADATFNLL